MSLSTLLIHHNIDGGVCFNSARLERCEYCRCNRHVCGCEERFEYEQIRDNPRLLAR